MTQPVIYYQTDSRWRYNDYSAKGEKTTIGASGCGPSSLSMVLATWCDKSVTPATECAWALAHGYKCPHSGTYYGYFVPACKRYGLTCKMLNGASIYGKSTSAYHATAKAAIDRGCLVIACMGKGNWTSSGHYIVVYNIIGNKIYINDPASSKLARTQGDYSLFKTQVKYYWIIEPPKKQEEVKPIVEPVKEKEEEEMDVNKFIAELTDEQAYTLLIKAQQHIATIAEPQWSVDEGAWKEAIEKKVINGGSPERYMKRDEVIVILKRLGVI